MVSLKSLVDFIMNAPPIELFTFKELFRFENLHESTISIIYPNGYIEKPPPFAANES
jgi:hypothetical protein